MTLTKSQVYAKIEAGELRYLSTVEVLRLVYDEVRGIYKRDQRYLFAELIKYDSMSAIENYETYRAVLMSLGECFPNLLFALEKELDTKHDNQIFYRQFKTKFKGLHLEHACH